MPGGTFPLPSWRGGVENHGQGVTGRALICPLLTAPSPTIPDPPDGHARLAGVLAVMFLLAPFASAPVAAAGPTVAPPGFAAQSSWIVELVPGAQSAVEGYGMARTTGGRLGQVYRHALTGFQFTGSAAAASALRSHPRVRRSRLTTPCSSWNPFPTGSSGSGHTTTTPRPIAHITRAIEGTARGSRSWTPGSTWITRTSRRPSTRVSARTA